MRFKIAFYYKLDSDRKVNEADLLFIIRLRKEKLKTSKSNNEFKITDFQIFIFMILLC